MGGLLPPSPVKSWCWAVPAIGKPSLLFIVILGDCSTDVGCGGGLLFEGRCIVESSLEDRLLRLPVKIAASCTLLAASFEWTC